MTNLKLLIAGVPLVTVFCAAGDLNGSVGSHFDTHADNFNRLKRDMLPPLDQASSALLEDLAVRGRLDETLAECPGSVEPFYAGYASITPLTEHRRLKADFYRLLLSLECVAWWGRDPEAAAWMPGEYRRLSELLAALEREV